MGRREDSGKPLDLPFGESPLPALRRPSAAHTVELLSQPISFASLAWFQPWLLAKDPDVRADDSSLAGRDGIDTAETVRSSRFPCQMMLYELNGPGG